MRFIRARVFSFPSPRDKRRLHLRRRRYASGLTSGQATPLHRRRHGSLLVERGEEERGGREEGESAGSARFGQSACTPPDNWPINGHQARGPERILLGQGAVAGVCSEERCAARSCVRPPSQRARGLSQARAGRPFPPRLGHRKPKVASVR